jgi:hypothetical protein
MCIPHVIFLSLGGWVHYKVVSDMMMRDFHVTWPDTGGWVCYRLIQEWDIHVNQESLLHYDIKLLKHEVLCDVSSLEVCDVFLGKPYICGSVMFSLNLGHY